MTDDPFDAPAAPAPDAPPAAPTRVVLVTGLSGAGNSTAIRVLEDMGHEAIDNLPLSLLPRIVWSEGGDPLPRPLALGVDVRTRGFTPDALRGRLKSMRADPAVDLTLVYLDCAADTLIDRFKTTRRRHPLAPEGGVEAGIARERRLLAPIRERADLVIDTTALSPHDLKARLADFVAQAHGPRESLSISVQSFSFKRGAPREADSVHDCRFLNNPHWDPALRRLDGRDAAVREYVEADPLYAPFLDRVADLTMMLLPAYRKEGKAYYCIALGCSGGQHRSVAAAEELTRRLREAGWRAALRHRELEGGPD